MDPNTAFDAMMTAVRAEDWETAKEHASDLRDWIVRGGFAPQRKHSGDWILTVLLH